MNDDELLNIKHSIDDEEFYNLLEDGLCPICKVDLEKAENCGGSTFDKTPTCPKCGARYDE